MASLQQVVDVLETLYPLRYAEEWDEPGLIVGEPGDPVRRIVFAVDPTMEIVDEAIAMHADLLVCHHPLFFRSVHTVAGTGFRGAIVGKLHRGHCALWVGHTNADVAYRGVGQAAADAFGLGLQRPLVFSGETQAGHEIGLGRIGELAGPMRLRDVAGRVAAALPQTRSGIQVCGDLDLPVRTVAVVPGSGDSLLDQVRESGADVYVTSDLRHHPVTDAIEQARYEASLRARHIAVGHGDANPRPSFINTPHSAIESLWLRYAADDVSEALAGITPSTPEVQVLARSTDPWTLVMGTTGNQGMG